MIHKPNNPGRCPLRVQRTLVFTALATGCIAALPQARAVAVQTVPDGAYEGASYGGTSIGTGANRPIREVSRSDALERVELREPGIVAAGMTRSEHGPVSFSVNGPVDPQYDGLLLGPLFFYPWQPPPTPVGAGPFPLARTNPVPQSTGIPTLQPGDVNDYRFVVPSSEGEIFQSEPELGPAGPPNGTNNQILHAWALGLDRGWYPNVNAYSFGEDFFNGDEEPLNAGGVWPEEWEGRQQVGGFVEPVVAGGGGPIRIFFSVDPFAIGLAGTSVQDEATLHGVLPPALADVGAGTGPWSSDGEAAGDVFHADPITAPGVNQLDHDEASMALLGPGNVPPEQGMEDDLDALEHVGTNTLYDGTAAEPGNTHDRVGPTAGFWGGTHPPDLGDPNNANHDPIGDAEHVNPIIFSVDRGSHGYMGSAVEAQVQSPIEGASGDLFIAVVLPQGPSWPTNMLLIDEGQLGLMPYDDLDAVFLRLMISPEELAYRIGLAEANFNPDGYGTERVYGFTVPLLNEGEAVVGFSVDASSIGLMGTAVDFECRVDSRGLAGPGYAGSGVMEQAGDVFFADLMAAPGGMVDTGTGLPLGQNFLWFEESDIGLDRGFWTFVGGGPSGDLADLPDELNALDSLQGCPEEEGVLCEPQGGGNPSHPPTYWYQVTYGGFCDFHVRVFDPNPANYTNWVAPANWVTSVHQVGDEWWASWWDPTEDCQHAIFTCFTFSFDNINPSVWGDWSITVGNSNDPYYMQADSSDNHTAEPDGYGYRVHVPTSILEACCLGDGTCVDLPPDDCTGTPQGAGTACQGDPDGDSVVDPCDNCPRTSNPSQANSDTVLLVNRDFELPAGVETTPDDFAHFTKDYRGGNTVEATYTCTGASQVGRIETDYSFDGGQAVYLYAYSGNPAVTPEACHRESGMQTAWAYDLTGKSKLSVWITGFTHSSAPTCEYVRTRFRLDDGTSNTYVDVFNYGQYVPVPPGYSNHVETATGTDGRTWRRFEVDIPAGWSKPDVTITLLTLARSWCAGYTVHSEIYADGLEVLPHHDSHGDACDNCPLVSNEDQRNSDPVIANRDFEVPPGVATTPDDFARFTKDYRGGNTVEATHTCSGALQQGQIDTTYSFDGDQAVYLYAYSGNPAVTPNACHRESGMETLDTYDLTYKTKLGIWATDFTHSSSTVCEYVRTRFRLDDGTSETYLDLFNYGQYVPDPPSYDDYVKMCGGNDGRMWRRFEVDIPEDWRKPDVTITILTLARSWCSGYTVHSGVYVDGLEALPLGDEHGDACDYCRYVGNPDQLDFDGDCPAPPYMEDPQCGDACEYKWVQLPDLSPNGIDVCDTSDVAYQFVLADDFECTNPEPIVRVDLWGSWTWGDPNEVEFVLSIHSDIPATFLKFCEGGDIPGEPCESDEDCIGGGVCELIPGEYSRPGELLWMHRFYPGEFTVQHHADVASHGWLEPPDYLLTNEHFTCWQYTFLIDPAEAFFQEGTPEEPVVYWLDAQAYPLEVGAHFGWKTSVSHWNDDAVYGWGAEPYAGPWGELRYPEGHAYEGQSMDLAFAINQGAAPRPSTPRPERLALPANPISQKVRYLSFEAGDAGRSQAIRVTFNATAPAYEHWTCAELWVQEPQEYCENSGTRQGAPCPIQVGDLSSTTLWASEMDCTPYYTDWTQYGVVHVFDEGITPGGVYDIQVINSAASLVIESNYSDPLTMIQSTWADLVKDCTTTPCGPPDGTTGIVDVSAVLDKFKNLTGNVIKARADLEGSPSGDHRIPDQMINITDVTYCLGAFLGQTYPAPGFPAPRPKPCP
jgi:hypothetical protein